MALETNGDSFSRGKKFFLRRVLDRFVLRAKTKSQNDDIASRGQASNITTMLLPHSDGAIRFFETCLIPELEGFSSQISDFRARVPDMDMSSSRGLLDSYNETCEKLSTHTAKPNAAIEEIAMSCAIMLTGLQQIAEAINGHKPIFTPVVELFIFIKIMMPQEPISLYYDLAGQENTAHGIKAAVEWLSLLADKTAKPNLSPVHKVRDVRLGANSTLLIPLGTVIQDVSLGRNSVLVCTNDQQKFLAAISNKSSSPSGSISMEHPAALEAGCSEDSELARESLEFGSRPRHILDDVHENIDMGDGSFLFVGSFGGDV